MNLTLALPEATRNVRIQLRPKRMLAAALITAVASITAYIYYSNSPTPNGLLEFLLISGTVILAIGGGIYCLQSINREKDQNTFDYQRVTRLTPLELTLGKLFGAPSLLYFIVICLLPITLVGAIASSQTVTTILLVYVILLLGSIAWHTFALLISLLMGRGAAAGAVVVFLLVVLMISSAEGNRGGMLALRGISPFFVIELVNPYARSLPASAIQLPAGRDLLFGMAVPHVLVLFVLYLSLTGWFLLALTRNIKRDPAMYEIYSPGQGFSFVLYLHLIVLALFQWTRLSYFNNPATRSFGYKPYQVAPMQAESEFLAVSLWFFAVFGLTLLRNRERVRRRILEFGSGAANWWAALWPGPYLLGGILAAGLAMIAMVRYELRPETGWSFGMAFFEVCFLAAWIVRDAIYLQWMNLRQGRRSLTTGLIYLTVFYVCSAALAAGIGSYQAQAGPYLKPWSIFEMSFDKWTATSGIWLAALIILVCEVLVFAALHRSQLIKLQESATA